MSYQFSYLVGCIIPLLLWGIIFVLRKDLRKEMLTISLFSALLAPLIGLVHMRDWWSPLMCTNTLIGVEDSLYAFAIAGLAVSLFQFVSGKRFVESKKLLDREMLIMIGSSLVVFFTLSFLFNSILAFVVISIGVSVFILSQRKDLVKYSISSAVLVMSVSIPAYLLVEFITPGWIVYTWQLDKLSGFFFLGIPIEEFIWHFFSGLSASLVYKFWKGSKELKSK